MNKRYILYNPLAGNGRCRNEVELLWIVHDNVEFCDMTRMEDYGAFFRGLDPSDRVILCGGDGTLNRFVNDTLGLTISNELYFYSVGSGNDFARDIGLPEGEESSVPINRYLEDLPRITVKGRDHLFLNGVGYGIDGYCCQEGDRLRAERQARNEGKPINYAAIAVKGLLGGYKPTNAVIRVDGREYTYQNVWLAPVMNGRYYGGGMMPAPGRTALPGRER